MSRINHNLTAMITAGSLNQNTNGIAKSLERLSTGLRINRASDDVTGLSVSEKIRAQLLGTGAAKRNANDGAALLNIAEGACDAISNMLQRARELAIQSDNDTYSTSDRSFADHEFQTLLSEVQRIAQTTQYNGMTLLDGVAGSFGVGSGNSSVLQIGANFTGTHANGTMSSLVVSILPITLGALGIPVGTTSVASRSGAFAAIDAVDMAIKSVNTVRSDLGAVINRLDQVVASLDVQETNMTSADSAIRDVDFAQEMTEFTRNQILSQSATSMLAQANQTPARVLELLK